MFQRTRNIKKTVGNSYNFNVAYIRCTENMDVSHYCVRCKASKQFTNLVLRSRSFFISISNVICILFPPKLELCHFKVRFTNWILNIKQAVGPSRRVTTFYKTLFL